MDASADAKPISGIQAAVVTRYGLSTAFTPEHQPYRTMQCHQPHHHLLHLVGNFRTSGHASLLRKAHKVLGCLVFTNESVRLHHLHLAVQSPRSHRHLQRVVFVMPRSSPCSNQQSASGRRGKTTWQIKNPSNLSRNQNSERCCDAHGSHRNLRRRKRRIGQAKPIIVA